MADRGASSKAGWPEHKGILLAGGRGTRLYPLTAVASKQLAGVFNKPMIYYALSTLMMGGVREVLIISTTEDLPRFESLFGDGAHLGMAISYAVQEDPRGIAEALVIGGEFVGDRPSILMLGDNVLYGRLDFLRRALAEHADSAVVFGYQVSNPEEYGVIDFDADWNVIALEEKPASPRSNWAVPGIYVYPPGASDLASRLEPSDRGELEITDLNRMYMDLGRLKVVPMGRGIAWFDTGSPEALLEAGNFIEAIERRQGLIVGSPEEVAFRMGFISATDLSGQASDMPASSYSRYLMEVAEDPIPGWAI